MKIRATTIPVVARDVSIGGSCGFDCLDQYRA
jgi:hypothetical protein